MEYETDRVRRPEAGREARRRDATRRGETRGNGAPILERSQLVVTSRAMSSVGARNDGGRRSSLSRRRRRRARRDLKRGVTWRRIARESRRLDGHGLARRHYGSRIPLA